MAGLYLHIPFCRQACAYCDFHFSTSLKNKHQLVQALIEEIQFYKNHWRSESFETVYFGGGTPSLLNRRELESLFESLYAHYTISPQAEITLESNPDDLSKSYVTTLRQLPFNRLSIGVQSFDGADLRLMNRSHSAQQARRAIANAQEAGFDNVSIDLIYGLPKRNTSDWKRNLTRLKAFQIPHFSAYALTVEPKTALAHQIQTGMQQPIDEIQQVKDFFVLQDWSEDNGYEAYEISNYAQSGFQSHHNSNYWKGKPYLGIGPAAHSFYHGKRRWNIANNNRYIETWQKGQPLAQSEVLGEKDRFNEQLMTQLRTAKGVDLAEMRARFGQAAVQQLRQALQNVCKAYYELKDERLRLSRAGRLHADGISAALFNI